MTRNLFFAAAASLTFLAPSGGAASAQEIGQAVGDIILMGHPECPRNFLPADGRLLSLEQYGQLYSLIGSTYGGDDRTTFGLPNLRGRTPLHYGSGPGLPTVALASTPGIEAHMMDYASLPTHWHEVAASTSEPTTTSPDGAAFASFPPGANRYAHNEEPEVPLQSGTVANSRSPGGVAFFSNIAPVLPLTYCIAVYGYTPQRN